MKYSFFSSVLFLSSLFATAQDSLVTDGPYIFYHNGMAYAKSVVKGNGIYKAVSDSFPETDRDKHLVTVHVDGHPEWDFTVNLKPVISIPSAITSDKNKSRVVVISDIEGEFEHFRDLLLATKVINKKYEWIFGKGKLVIAGDLFDRGTQVCQFLWLLYKLEGEAAEKGGEVHVILGNHDIMNLSGDFRYVESVYTHNSNLMATSYGSLYASDTELGRWLRSKNIIENINGLLVMHGGVSPEVLSQKRSVDVINQICRPYYDQPQNIPDSLKDMFNKNALFWYRGYFVDPRADELLVDSTLAFYGARRIIVGHDIIDHISMLFHGKVIGVDVNEHEGRHEALMIRRGKFTRIDVFGNSVTLVGM